MKWRVTYSGQQLRCWPACNHRHEQQSPSIWAKLELCQYWKQNKGTISVSERDFFTKCNRNLFSIHKKCSAISPTDWECADLSKCRRKRKRFFKCWPEISFLIAATTRVLKMHKMLHEHLRWMQITVKKQIACFLDNGIVLLFCGRHFHFMLQIASGGIFCQIKI